MASLLAPVILYFLYFLKKLFGVRYNEKMEKAN